MSGRKKNDPLLTIIEQALDLGRFVSYVQSSDFVNGLGQAKSAIDALIASGETQRALPLYETFLAGCYEKAEEIDDSGGSLGDFFEDLFAAWIDARERAGCDPHETVRQILSWMENDAYGFCYGIEERIAQVLGQKTLVLFKKHYEDRLESSLHSFKDSPPRYISDYPPEVRGPVSALKAIYVVVKDIQSYLVLCARILPSPKDCEDIAALYITKRCFADALEWVEQGLAFEEERSWGNLSGYSLNNMRRELLNKLGRTSEAFDSVWEAFKKAPSWYGYVDLMKYVPRDDLLPWHNKAMAAARIGSQSTFIEICTKKKEWDALAMHINSVDRKQLEGISHCVTEKAAQGLKKNHPAAAAKIFCALGGRILANGKSKYYRIALVHFQAARKCIAKAGSTEMWLSFVQEMRKSHSRKYSFMEDFEKIIAGHAPEAIESFKERTRKRWRKQITKQ